MTRRSSRAAGGGGLPWYLSDLDVEVVGGSGGSIHDRGASPPSSDGDSGVGRSYNNNKNNKRRDRPYHFDSASDDPYVFVPADPSSLVKGGGSGGRSASASRRRRDQSTVPTASFITILLGVLTVFYFGYLRYTSKSVPLSDKSRVTAAHVGAKRSKKSRRKKRLKDKRKKALSSREKQHEVAVTTSRRKEQTAAIAVKEEEQEALTNITTTTAVIKKEEETFTQIISSEPPQTPKRRAARGEQVVHATPARSGVSGAMQLATPKTPQEYKLSVEQIASVVSSTGLDKQHSLQIANEVVIRRMETQISQDHLVERDMRREELEERRREEDKQDADRRHEESLTAIRGEKSLIDKMIDARTRCRDVALQMFPGRQFLLCISVALISMFLSLNFASVIREVYDDEANRTAFFALRRVCGCLDDGGKQQSEGSQLAFYYYSYLRYASDLCPCALSGYVFAPLSLWLGSLTCLASCAIKYVFSLGIYVAALAQAHRFLRAFHSFEFVHQAVNVVSVSALLLSKLVYQSNHHHSSAELLWDLARVIAAANIIMSVLCVAVSSSKHFDDKALRRTEHVNKRGLERNLLCLTWLPSTVRISSTLVAITVGIYWGTR
jgi:hypothetical protein